MVHIKDIHKGSKLRQIKEISSPNGEIGYIGKEYIVRSIQQKPDGKIVVFEEKIEDDYFAVYEECLDLFMVVKESEVGING